MSKVIFFLCVAVVSQCLARTVNWPKTNTTKLQGPSSSYSFLPKNLRICAFNIKTFGRAKMSDPFKAGIIRDVSCHGSLSRYNIIYAAISIHTMLIVWLFVFVKLNCNVCACVRICLPCFAHYLIWAILEYQKRLRIAKVTQHLSWKTERSKTVLTDE